MPPDVDIIFGGDLAAACEFPVVPWVINSFPRFSVCEPASCPPALPFPPRFSPSVNASPTLYAAPSNATAYYVCNDIPSSSTSKHDNKVLPEIMGGFHRNAQRSPALSLETVRDNYRHILASSNPSSFRFGMYCSAHELLDGLLTVTKVFMTTTFVCSTSTFHRARRQPRNVKTTLISGHGVTPQTSTYEWLSINPPASVLQKCSTCNSVMYKSYKINFAPPILAFSCEGNPNLKIDLTVDLILNAGRTTVKYYLFGVVYWWQQTSHFTSRLIVNRTSVFKHDGMLFDGKPILEPGEPHCFDFRVCGEGIASLAIYSKV